MKLMWRKTLLTIALPLVLSHPFAAAAQNVVDVALEGIGTASAEQMQNRIFSTPLTVLGPEFRDRAIHELPDSIRRNRLTEGKLLRKVERVMSTIIRLHGCDRKGQIDLFLFRGDVPQAMLFRGCILLISDSLADALYDDELAGIIAHELGHSYFMDEMVAARKTDDASAMRVVELKCDAVAMLSLQLMGRDPSLLLRGLKRIHTITKSKGLSSSVFQSHPELVERAQFSDRFQRLLIDGSHRTNVSKIISSPRDTTFLIHSLQ